MTARTGTAPVRWVRRPLRLWVSTLAVQELEAVCRRLFELAPAAAPEREVLREALWGDLTETVRALLKVGRDAELAEERDMVQWVRRVGEPAVRQLRETGRWPGSGGGGVVRGSALLFLPAGAREIVESFRKLLAAGQEAEGLDRERRPARADLADVLEEVDDLAAGFAAIGEEAGAGLAAEIAAGLREEAPEEGEAWAELCEGDGGQPMPLEVRLCSVREEAGVG